MIGIFDSGSGGLTVLKEIRKQAPKADIIYFGDMRNIPYGSKSRKEISKLTLEGLSRLRMLGATEIVNACNSMTAALDITLLQVANIRSTHVIGMVGPTVVGLRDAGYQSVTVVATEATVTAGLYQESLNMIGIKNTAHALPNLVTAIEAGAEKESLFTIIDASLKRMDALSDSEALVLGCTHFPIVEEVFRAVLEKHGKYNMKLINPAVYVAPQVNTYFDTTGKGHLKFLLSADSSFFRRIVREWFVEDSYAVDVTELFPSIVLVDVNKDKETRRDVPSRAS